jgi:SAM-dependent methyltransferase
MSGKTKMNDSWMSGNPYERFMGRWSTLIAREFLEWLAVPHDRRWLDVGCGTGSLTKQILELNQPQDIIAIDSSLDFISHARQTITDPSVRFEVGNVFSLDIDSKSVDVVASGLMLNFVPQHGEAIREMLRVTKPGGTIGIFLWDYAGSMEMLRYFWDAAVEVDPAAEQFDEGIRFPLCLEGQLESLIRDSGVKQVEAIAIDIPTVFQSFDDYWTPFLGNVGPAPSFVMGLNKQDRYRLKNILRESLPINDDGTISLIARAWAVKGDA